ncbi:hypothetical protein CK203_003371 [Vitis vinifera]|uniref:Uncharacterized protein n=1 Tax=Vitis vinifera TaxID=29760 RepID=A0A438K7M6_VITVI|nr:hypothetical protein CK203_003371 [Vitis vinifera]
MEQRTWIEPEPGPNSGYLQKFRLYETRAVEVAVTYALHIYRMNGGLFLLRLHSFMQRWLRISAIIDADPLISVFLGIASSFSLLLRDGCEK